MRLNQPRSRSLQQQLSLLDQAIAYGSGAVLSSAVESMLGAVSREYLLKLLDALATQDVKKLIDEARNIIAHSPDYQRICADILSIFQQMALYKCDPKIEFEDLLHSDAVEALCAQWSMEEIQLYYQIMLQGRKDLNLSPDESSGFEMLMLRLYAFSPDSPGVETETEEKKSP